MWISIVFLTWKKNRSFNIRILQKVRCYFFRYPFTFSKKYDNTLFPRKFISLPQTKNHLSTSVKKLHRFFFYSSDRRSPIYPRTPRKPASCQNSQRSSAWASTVSCVALQVYPPSSRRLSSRSLVWTPRNTAWCPVWPARSRDDWRWPVASSRARRS